MEEEIVDIIIKHDVEKLKGLAVRVDKILGEEVEREKMQCSFMEARMPNIKSVGVQGDDTSYKYPAEITIKDPKKPDGTNYRESEFYAFLSRLSSRITNEIGEINRVVYTTKIRDDKSSFF